jgi:hypothetical protein
MTASWRALQLSLAMSSATSYQEFIDTLADALDETLRQPAFISFERQRDGFMEVEPVEGHR